MKLEEAKTQFIQVWGTLGTDWGINRTMAQIHAVLLLSPKPLSMDQLMEELSISRGNVNMNLRELIAWGLVRREIIPGERREYFVGEKDIWEVAKCVMRERKKRELEPLKKTIDKLVKVTPDPTSEEYQTFINVTKDIQKIADGVDTLLTRLTQVERSWFVEKIVHLFTTKKKRK